MRAETEERSGNQIAKEIELIFLSQVLRCVNRDSESIRYLPEITPSVHEGVKI